MHHVHPTGIVKTVFVRGTTDSLGTFEVDIERSEADLSLGRWRMCIDSLIVTPLVEYSRDIAASVSATHTFSHIQASSGRTRVLQPTRQLLFVLRHGYGDTPLIAAANRSVWLEIQTPSNVFNLLFQDAETDQGLKLKLQGQLLLTRVIEQR